MMSVMEKDPTPFPKYITPAQQTVNYPGLHHPIKPTNRSSSIDRTGGAHSPTFTYTSPYPYSNVHSLDRLVESHSNYPSRTTSWGNTCSSNLGAQFAQEHGEGPFMIEALERVSKLAPVQGRDFPTVRGQGHQSNLFFLPPPLPDPSCTIYIICYLLHIPHLDMTLELISTAYMNQQTKK